MKNLEKQAFLKITKQRSESCEIHFRMLFRERISQHLWKHYTEGETF